jgi:hypothetical protein
MRAAAASTCRLVALLLLLGACTDHPAETLITLPPAPAQSDALACQADVGARTLGCDASIGGGVFAFAGAGGPRLQIIGGQGINVRLTSSNISESGLTSQEWRRASNIWGSFAVSPSRDRASERILEGRLLHTYVSKTTLATYWTGLKLR